MSRDFGTDITMIEHIEMAENDIDYVNQVVTLFTWNPKDREVGYMSPQKKWDTMILRYLKHLKRCCRYYCIVPEFSDSGRLHCHGWIIIEDKIKWLKSVRPRFFNTGSFRTDKLIDPNKGMSYHKKDLKVTEGMLDNPTPYTHFTNDDIFRDCALRYMAFVAETIKDKKPIIKAKSVDIASFFDWPDTLE